MSASKSERLMNLLILLLVSRSYLSKEQIRQGLEAYRGSSEEAFERMFERDKEELRSLGVPIEVGSHDAYFDDETGYRIKRDAFELPEVDFTPDEAAMVGLAARVWQHAGLARATSTAVVKLQAAGAEVDRAALDVAQPALYADEEAFEAMHEATAAHLPVGFDYQSPTSPEPTRRRLEPWGVVHAHGRWYVVGRDLDRGEPRMFRLSRVRGQVKIDRRAKPFAVPEGTDIRALAASLERDRTTDSATLRVRHGAAADLRRRARVVEPGEGWDLVILDMADADAFAGDVLSHLDAVEVVAPEGLRHQVVSRLQGVLR